MILGYFSILGYVSVLLWMLVPLLWVMHSRQRPRRWLCHMALGAAIAAYLLAVLNSSMHVDRIQIDRSEEIAASQARQEKARQDAIDARGDDVANVSFAEDGVNDSLDQGGMDEADRKYMATFDEDSTPDWKKEKKSRSETAATDDSLDGMIDTTEDEKGADTTVIEQKAEREPIMMPEKHMMAANRLDGLNLKLIRLFMLVGLGYVVVDYLKRANIYEESYLPLPLPSTWLNGLTPMLPVRTLPEKGRRNIPEELERLIQRGDTYLYLTDDPEKAGQIPEKTWRIAKPSLLPVDIIRVTDEDPISSAFIFETLWYGRSSFVVASYDRSVQLLGWLMELLAQRKASRAKVGQTVHIVWDLDVPLTEDWLAEFAKLTRATGMSLLVRPVKEG